MEIWAINLGESNYSLATSYVHAEFDGSYFFKFTVRNRFTNLNLNLSNLFIWVISPYLWVVLTWCCLPMKTASSRMKFSTSSHSTGSIVNGVDPSDVNFGLRQTMVVWWWIWVREACVDTWSTGLTLSGRFHVQYIKTVHEVNLPGWNWNCTFPL